MPARRRSKPGNDAGGHAAILALVASAMLVVSLDQYIVVVALPEIGRDLGYSARSLQSVVSAYAIASAGFLLLGGRAVDLFGRRRVFLTGLALYATASLAGGFATTPEFLVASRAAQGIGGALVFPGDPRHHQHHVRRGPRAEPCPLGLGGRRALPGWSSASCSAAC